VLIAQRDGAVAHLLDRLLEAAEAGARMGSAIEILLLQALAAQSENNLPEALTILARALALAEPEGYVRIFADEGEPMVALLRRAHADGIARGYVAKLLAAVRKQGRTGLDLPVRFPPHPGQASSESRLVEPLTDRELDVLRLLATGASNREIARKLMVSVGTVKRHVYNIFGKLEASNRTQAVAKARAQNLVSL
jgi:LuxR family maltose regulon positive regulatory protein